MNFWAVKAEYSLIVAVFFRGMYVCHKKNIFTEQKVRIVVITTLGSAMSMKCRKKQVQRTKKLKKKRIKLKEITKGIKNKEKIKNVPSNSNTCFYCQKRGENFLQSLYLKMFLDPLSMRYRF